MTTTEILEGNWPIWKKIIFKFLFIFLSLFVLSGRNFYYSEPIGLIPGVNYLLATYASAMKWLVIWTGEHILGIEESITFQATGSADTLFLWAESGLYLIIGLVGCILWTIMDKNRCNYPTLLKWFNLIMVYNFCYHLTSYGLIKVFGGQFFPPSVSSLLGPFGDNSPMAILWLSMGSAPVYSKFTGWVETITVLLLLFRRTRTLGSLMAIGVMVNVFVINMTYDVPVKSLSFRLLITTLWLGAQDYRRFLGILLTNKQVRASNAWPQLFTTPWKKYAALLIAMIILGWEGYNNIAYGLSVHKNLKAEKPPLYGVHEVETFMVNGDTIPPLLGDNLRWKQTYVNYRAWNASSYYVVKTMDDRTVRYKMDVDTARKSIRLESYRDSTEVHMLHYKLDSSDLFLNGEFKGESIEVKMKWYQPRDFVLNNWGFNWVNPGPPNFSYDYRLYRDTPYYKD